MVHVFPLFSLLIPLSRHTLKKQAKWIDSVVWKKENAERIEMLFIMNDSAFSEIVIPSPIDIVHDAKLKIEDMKMKN